MQAMIDPYGPSHNDRTPEHQLSADQSTRWTVLLAALIGPHTGDAEFAGQENEGQRNFGVENAGLENDGQHCRGGKCRTGN